MNNDSENNIVDNAVAEGGAYEIIRKRLTEQGNRLSELSDSLNQARTQEFGSVQMEVKGRVRIRTENNSIARDIVQVGEYLLFGYNVFIGLKKETKVEDVFSVFTATHGDDIQLEPVTISDTFLADTRFQNDFSELYRYYKNAKLLQLVVKDGKLLAGFQIGERIEDTRVFRWSVSADGKEVSYIDNRGERDIQLPPRYDFEWIDVTRDDTIHGRHPHASIMDEVFVETVGGTLTVKIENNTEDGLGIYNEPVDDQTQSLDDADMAYASLGSLILLKIKPYRETQTRYLVFNRIHKTVVRIDALGQSCIQLPEDHGVIFPGGYYLQSGEYKKFGDANEGLSYKRTIKSPNGEDVLFVFYEPEEGLAALLTYNLINKSLQNPIYGHGYAFAEDGTLIIFTAENEATRVHPMQVWETPYISQEFAAKIPPKQNFYGRVGNTELVRGISDLLSVCRAVKVEEVSLGLYEDLSKNTKKLFDDYYWLESEETAEIKQALKDITETAELVIDEFEKVQAIQKKSIEALKEAELQQEKLAIEVRPDNWEYADQYVDALKKIRHQRGHLATIKTYRYMNVERIEELDAALVGFDENLAEKTVVFLSTPTAIDPYLVKVDEFLAATESANTKAKLDPIIEDVENTATGLDLLSELMATLQVDDATVRTQIIDAISEVYAKLNQAKAKARNKQQDLGSEEAVAQFSAQFKLFSQSIANALGLSTTPDRCDEQLSRLLVQLEELESQFSEFDQFLADILAKRDEVYEAFESHKQQLLDAQQRKAQNIADAADRVISSIDRRSQKFTEQDELNTYFASDALVLKLRQMVDQLNELSSAVKADDIEARLKAIKESALRSLRDKSDIYEAGGSVIKLGPKHKFSVNTQELDLTIIPRDESLYFHLSGTDYYERVAHAELNELKAYWKLSLVSESEEVYRSEYLAVKMINDAKQNLNGLSDAALRSAVSDQEALLGLVRQYAGPRYKEGYEKGIHDHDAVLIIQNILPVSETAGLLRFDPTSRALAQIFWANIQYLSGLSTQAFNQRQSNDTGKQTNVEFTKALGHDTWQDRAQSAAHMQDVFMSLQATLLLTDEVEAALHDFIAQHPIPVSETIQRRAAEYLVAELSRERLEFVVSKYARQLVDLLKLAMGDQSWKRYQLSLEKMLGWPAERWKLSTAWLDAFIKQAENGSQAEQLQGLARYIPEAVALINSQERIERRHTEVDLKITVTGLLGNHANIANQSLHFDLDEFLLRLEHHQQEVVSGYERYLSLRQTVINTEKDRLKLDQFKPKPLSSFVRNRLVNESYLPLIGDNLAKQMGTVGENKRSDLMGLLMMISPPGYGKTTLMEYVASRLGLIFMKINCPSLGHDVLSLDPNQAPNATAQQELIKVNLAFEMGNNVMLYLDDIQHTHPEFLQKFISLCDGTRRIEGVWNEQTKTYDMRGKKFCVVMAGNPYTEAGEAFKVPDMLANRADIYNLGDILGGMEEQFALSYIENCLTSNTVLAPLATREMADVYKLVDLAKGKDVATSDLSHSYSGAEVNEITSVLAKLFVIQDVVLKINQQYIASAAQDDKFRIEPSFKLQGSYRNMNKMAEKVSSVMNESELQQMIDDHYLGEAQMLTTGAEANLLKLKELRGVLDQEEQSRWEGIKKDFLRNKAMGGGDDIGGKVVAQLIDLVEGVTSLNDAASVVAESSRASQQLHTQQLKSQQQEKQPDQQADTVPPGIPELRVIAQSLKKLEAGLRSDASEKVVQQPQQTHVEVINQPVPGMNKVLQVLAKTIEESIFPLVRSMDKKLEIDLRTHDKMQSILENLRNLENEVTKVKSTRVSK